MKVIIKNARLSFNDLFKAKGIKGGDPKFSATLICLDGSDEAGNKTTISYTNADGKKINAPFAKMEDLCNHVLKEKFGKVPAKCANWAFNKADGSTHREKYVTEDGDYWAGFGDETFYISASKNEDKCKDGKMTILDQQKQQINANAGLIFSGCYVNAVIDIYAYENEKSGKGVTASLEGIQLKKKGEALGITQIDAADEFDEEEIEEIENEADDLM